MTNHRFTLVSDSGTSERTGDDWTSAFAVCDCGWVGDGRDSKWGAADDYRDHMNEVEPIDG